MDLKELDNLSLNIREESDPEVKNLLKKLESAITLINNAIPRSISLPKIFQIRGSVKVENDLKITNFKDLEKYFGNIETQLRMLTHAISSVPQQKIDFPKLEIPKAEKIDFTSVTEAIQSLEGVLNKSTDSDSLPVLRDIKKSIQSLVERPQMTPTPVTNVTLNPLNGFVKTTSATVGTSATSLPGYGQLFNRRAVVIYNNSANTIYIGGSDVTTSNGMPVPANSYSPILDAGYSLLVYGIAAQSNNVRVLEISKDKSDTIQQ